MESLMTEETTNIYKAPESDLSVNSSSDGVQNFSRFTAWGVFGLSIITFGIYPIYWLYSRAQVLNGFHERKISNGLLMTLLVVVITSFLIGFAQGFSEELGFIDALAGLLNLAYFILYLVVLFGFRNRMINVLNTSLNPVFTFFGNVIYLQYKINQAIDNQQ